MANQYKTTSIIQCASEPAPDPIVPEGDEWELLHDGIDHLAPELHRYRWTWVRAQAEGEDRVLTQ